MHIKRDEDGLIVVDKELISSSEAREMQRFLLPQLENFINSNVHLVEELKSRRLESNLLGKLSTFESIKNQIIENIDDKSPNDPGQLD